MLWFWIVGAIAMLAIFGLTIKEIITYKETIRTIAGIGLIVIMTMFYLICLWSYYNPQYQ